MSQLALVDGNNFFVSYQRVFEPNLNNRPVVVLSNNDGCVIARSNEAKALGIKMSQPHFQIRQTINDHNVKVFSSNLELYCDMSERMMTILRKYAPRIEVYSIDEAFLDFSEVKACDLIKIGHAIRKDILKCLGLPVCVGFAPTKTLAKVANHFAKQYLEYQGVYSYERSTEVSSKLSLINIEDVWGIGPASCKKLKAYGLKTAYDLATLPKQLIRNSLSVVGEKTQQELNGISCYLLEETREPKKSITVSRSLKTPTLSKERVKEALATHITRACEKLRKDGLVAKGVTIFISTTRHTKGHFFETSPSLILYEETNLTPPFLRAVIHLLEKNFKDGHAYKKIGVTLTHICESHLKEGSLFTTSFTDSSALVLSIDNLNKRYGSKSIIYGATGLKVMQSEAPKNLSPRYTTRFEEILTVF